MTLKRIVCIFLVLSLFLIAICGCAPSGGASENGAENGEETKTKKTKKREKTKC